MNYAYGCMMQCFTQESYTANNQVLLFSKEIERNQQNLIELREKTREIHKETSRLGDERSRLAAKVRATQPSAFANADIAISCVYVSSILLILIPFVYFTL